MQNVLFFKRTFLQPIDLCTAHLRAKSFYLIEVGFSSENPSVKYFLKQWRAHNFSEQNMFKRRSLLRHLRCYQDLCYMCVHWRSLDREIWLYMLYTILTCSWGRCLDVKRKSRPWWIDQMSFRNRCHSFLFMPRRPRRRCSHHQPSFMHTGFVEEENVRNN